MIQPTSAPLLMDEWSVTAPQQPELFYELQGDGAAYAHQVFETGRGDLELRRQAQLDIPQIVVAKTGEDTFSAAQKYPTLYRLPNGDGYTYYAAVPVSYKRDHTPPNDARLIEENGTEAQHIYTGLFANGHSTPRAIETKPSVEIEVPLNFDRRYHITAPQI